MKAFFKNFWKSEAEINRKRVDNVYDASETFLTKFISHHKEALKKAFDDVGNESLSHVTITSTNSDSTSTNGEISYEIYAVTDSTNRREVYPPQGAEYNLLESGSESVSEISDYKLKFKNNGRDFMLKALLCVFDRMYERGGNIQQAIVIKIKIKNNEVDGN